MPLAGALFSEDRTRRRWLGRRIERPAVGSPFATDADRLLIIGCNPSNADEQDNDPTITKELKFAARWGFGHLDKMNIFDVVSPHPTDLYGELEPVSPQNEQLLLEVAARCSMVLCAWGKHGKHLVRGARTRRVLLEAGHTLWALKINKDGSPQHPLYIPDATDPFEWARSTI
jgi:hypothetical protein